VIIYDKCTRGKADIAIFAFSLPRRIINDAEQYDNINMVVNELEC
jgi:hypothetical protein